uniref:Uncharacterized protein n=1 Tax=Romanomermis culicivorax TaxID=13658 RepID=A0A915KGB9_ROMCU
MGFENGRNRFQETTSIGSVGVATQASNHGVKFGFPIRRHGTHQTDQIRRTNDVHAASDR